MAKKMTKVKCIKGSKEEGFVLGEIYTMVDECGKHWDVENSEGTCHLMTEEYFKKIKK